MSDEKTISVSDAKAVVKNWKNARKEVEEAQALVEQKKEALNDIANNAVASLSGILFREKDGTLRFFGGTRGGNITLRASPPKMNVAERRVIDL